MTDVLTKEQRRRNMQNIRSKDTKIELQLRKKLWEKGIRYRKNYSKIPGRPDIALTKYKIAIFCDSEFFHGKDWDEQKERLSKSDNGQFWIKKISGNIERDAAVDRDLRALGWTVLRFWGEEIKKKPEICIKAIEEAIFQAKLEEFGTVK
jgi:DNA mismatch endonuclease (patch repair protein)